MSPTGSKNAPEAKAREKIDALLVQAGRLTQDRDNMNLTAGDAIAVREFRLEKGHGYVDYLLFGDGSAVGVVEAKPAGYCFTTVEVRADKYVQGLPDALTAPIKPLPFAYISTGEETVFINTLDPHQRSRSVFSFHTCAILHRRGEPTVGCLLAIPHPRPATHPPKGTVNACH